MPSRGEGGRPADDMRSINGHLPRRAAEPIHSPREVFDELRRFTSVGLGLGCADAGALRALRADPTGRSVSGAQRIARLRASQASRAASESWTDPAVGRRAERSYCRARAGLNGG